VSLPPTSGGTGYRRGGLRPTRSNRAGRSGIDHSALSARAVIRVDPDFGDEFRQSSGASLATSTSRVLDRYLNVLPTVTIREGHRIKVYLTNDLELPAYAPVTGEVR